MASDELTLEQAVALMATGWWKTRTPREIAEFQLYTRRLCMPFGEFHEAVEKALGRSVWTHEFAKAEELRAELRGDRAAPTFQEIMEMIPEAKRVVLVDETPSAQ